MKKIVSAILACVLCASVAVAAAGCGCQKSKNDAKATSGKTTSGSNEPGYRIEPTDPSFTKGDFGFYRLNDSEVKVTVYKGSSKKVEIPASVDGSAVTVIERDLFKGSDIESVTIPASVREIQDYAFSQCKNLKEIVVPEGVKTIGSHAFWYSPALEKITLPSTLKKIGPYAFSATGLKSITIPETDNTLSSLDEFLFFQCANLTEVTIPLSITGIADNAFNECSADLVIKAYTGSCGAQFAKSHNIKLEELKRPKQ